MKNKNKFWRRMATKSFEGTVEIRNGRKIRDLMRSTSSNKGGILPIHLFMFKSGGIDTPVFDKMYADLYNSNKSAEASVESNIEDAEIISLDSNPNEGVMNAAST